MVLVEDRSDSSMSVPDEGSLLLYHDQRLPQRHGYESPCWICKSLITPKTGCKIL